MRHYFAIGKNTRQGEGSQIYPSPYSAEESLIAMFDAQAQTRINKCCSDAAFGYLTATGAAYAAFAEQAAGYWTEMLKAAVPAPAPEKPKSWYVPPPEVSSSTSRASTPAGPWACMMPWMGASQMSAMPGSANDSLLGFPTWMWGPFAPWVAMSDPRTAMAWPMACGMMAIGVPQTVAWPTAQANVAAMDALNTAAKSVESAVVSYRSSGGHAVARIVNSAPVAAPFALLFLIAPLSAEGLTMLSDLGRVGFW
ncbi:hypothetical protein SAMN04488061_3422 [Filomicrobium insigne]|uniref:Uncharacterized protein n=1 Tax=Filomicrobium insigne TaxID=418854 RepID=A0A1H0TYU5_9HYPH|nr:hypothetical protein [Filomicrobium insigne]SDP58726.1 hypothetical protein SAMN04488061_3422 [Filomicrobium insigne]